MNRHKTVLLALGYYFSDMVRGVVTYARKNNWRIVFLRGVAPEEGLKQWRGEGVITSLSEDSLTCRSWGSTKIVSLIRFKHSLLPVSLVRENDYEIGKIAAEFFLRCGHVNFAAYSDTKRLDGFRDTLKNYGYSCDDLRPSESVWRPERRIVEWILSLPKPCAVICENDWDGAELLALAKWNNIDVPKELSILGVGNDTQICDTSDLTLSSIDSRLYEIGYTAAEELDRLMNGGKPNQVFISPNPFVAERKSTDFFFSEDERLTTIIDWMKKHLDSQFSIDVMAKDFALSESALYKMFVKHLKLSPKQFLLDLRLKRACDLLQQSHRSGLTMDIIASQSGFPTVCAMFTGFRKRFGCAPGEWRRQRMYFDKSAL